VLAKVAGEMSKQPVKASSLAFLGGSSDIRRGGVSRFQRSMEVAERIKGQPGVELSMYQEARLALQPVIEQLHRVQQQAVEAVRHVQERVRQRRPGRSLSM